MPAQMMEAPIVTLVRFWANHHLLDLVQRPVWRVVKDRSRSYVSAICAGEQTVHAGFPLACSISLHRCLFQATGWTMQAQQGCASCH